MQRDYGGKVKETRNEYRRRFSQPEAEPVEIPQAGYYLWEWFWEIASQRKEQQPIGWESIKAWSDLVGVRLTPDEVRALVLMDDQYLRTNYDEQEAVNDLHRGREEAKKLAKR